MKNKLFLIVLLLVVSVGFYACKKDKKDKPVADFTYTYIDHGGVEVTYNGNGLPYWDMGGTGVQIGDDYTFKYYYVTNGAHDIKLTTKVYSDPTTYKSADKTQSITIVGVPTKVKVTSVKLMNFRDTDNAGHSWDSDGTGPDITFAYIDPTYGYQDLTGLYPNLTHDQLPISVTFTTPKIIDIVSGRSFDIVCYDDNHKNVAEIEGINSIANNQTAKSNCSGNCSGFIIYPSKYSSENGHIQIGLEWLP